MEVGQTQGSLHSLSLASGGGQPQPVPGPDSTQCTTMQ